MRSTTSSTIAIRIFICKDCLERTRSFARRNLEYVPMHILICNNRVDRVRSFAMRVFIGENCVDRAGWPRKNDLEDIPMHILSCNVCTALGRLRS